VRVKWIKQDESGSKYNIGAEFINMPQEVTTRFIKYINNNLKDAGGKPKKRRRRRS